MMILYLMNFLIFSIKKLTSLQKVIFSTTETTEIT